MSFLAELPPVRRLRLPFTRRRAFFHLDGVVYEALGSLGRRDGTWEELLLARDERRRGLDALCVVERLHRSLDGRWAREDDVLRAALRCEPSGRVSTAAKLRDALWRYTRDRQELAAELLWLEHELPGRVLPWRVDPLSYLGGGYSGRGRPAGFDGKPVLR